MAAEMALDQAPASGEIGITNGQCPKTVKVFWQDHDGIDSERVLAHRITKCLAQQRNVFGDAQERTPVVCDNREKERATGSLGPTIVHVTRVGAINGRPGTKTLGFVPQPNLRDWRSFLGRLPYTSSSRTICSYSAIVSRMGETPNSRRRTSWHALNSRRAWLRRPMRL
jgi:hypothetical protein